MTKIVAFYARVSTEDQRERETIRTQIEYARQRAAIEGWELLEFSDDGVSGTIPLIARPGGAALLAAARDGDFDVATTVRLDRLGRSQRVVLDAIDVLKAHGVRYRSLTENFDLGTPFGDAALGMTSVFAQLERDTIAHRTRAGLDRVARESGRHLGGRAPYGYRVEGKHLVAEERPLAGTEMSPAGVVRYVLERYVAEDIGLDALAAVLNARGIPPPPRAEKWHTSMLGRFIRLSRYRGEQRWGSIVRDVPPIVSHALQRAAQEKARQNYRWKRAHERRLYVFRGVLTCECGLALTGHTYYTKRDHSAWRKAYRCSWDHRLDKPAPVVREHELLPLVWADLESFLAEPDALVIRILRDRSDPLPRELSAERELVELADRMRELEERESRLTDEYATNLFRADVLERKVAELRQQREKLEQRAKRVRRDRATAARDGIDAVVLRTILEKLAERVRTADEATQAAILKLLIRRTRVEQTGKHRARVEVVWAFGLTSPDVSSEVPTARLSSRYRRKNAVASPVAVGRTVGLLRWW